MTRCFGLMPSDEIEKSAEYVDQSGKHIGIDAGRHGWTIRWADLSCTYADVDDTTENNFAKALKNVNMRGFELTICQAQAESKASEGDDLCKAKKTLQMVKDAMETDVLYAPGASPTYEQAEKARVIYAAVCKTLEELGEKKASCQTIGEV